MSKMRERDVSIRCVLEPHARSLNDFVNEVHNRAVFMELQFKFLPIGGMHLKLIKNSMDFNLTTTIASTAT